MSQATNRRYEHDALLRINAHYHDEHTLTQEDVDAVNSMAIHIGAILLPVKSVDIMGDARTYESCVALRAVASTDGMTAVWEYLPYEFLSNLSNEIINKVCGVNRVVYDISSKPPATIEWE